MGSFLEGLGFMDVSTKKRKGLFIVLLIVNTLGLLEIFYIFIYSQFLKKQENQ